MEVKNRQIIKVLEYLRDNEESTNSNRSPMIMGLKLSMERKSLEEILELLLNARAIERFLHLGSHKFHLPQQESDIYNYYKITKRGTRQLSRGTWTKPLKKTKVPLTEEQKRERKKTRRENIRHWWLLFTIIATAIGGVIWALDFFLGFNVWKFIKSMI